MFYKKLFIALLILIGSYLFLNYCFIWLSPFFLAYLIFKTIYYFAHKFPFTIPLLPFLLFFVFLLICFASFFLLSLSFIRFIKVFLQTDFFNQLLLFFQSLQLPSTLESFLESLIQQSIPFLSSILFIFPKLLSFLSLSCLIAFLMITHPIKLELPFHLSLQNKLNQLHDLFITTLKNMVKSTLILMIFTWIECFIGLLLIQEPHAFSLSLFIACFDSLPILGVGTVLLPLSLAQFFLGYPKKALGLLIIYVVVSCIKFFLEPKIVSKQMGIPVLFHLLSMVICLNLFGGIGLLYAPFLCRISVDLLHNKQQINQTITKELTP